MIEDVELIETTTREHYLAEHELLLSFNNDSGAEKFVDWWYYEGKEIFEDYCKESSGVY